MHNGYQHMVLDDYVARLRDIRTTRRSRLGALRTRADVRAYQSQCLRSVKRAFSPRPRRTALNASVTNSLDFDSFRIDTLLLESRPQFLVSANLYIPQDRVPPFPVVLGVCGHSAEGKACSVYHAFCQRLVHNGFMVLIYEPCNQGERDQYIDVPDRECVAGCCQAHNMMGKQLELLGEYYGMWRVWDGIRCLDYLLQREEADPTIVGLTGNSGGGTMTEWLWAVDERFTMAAPSCFVTSFLCNLENELPADCEQYPPGVIGDGLEMADLMVPRAPKPLLLLGQTYDFFDRRGLREAYEELKRIYRKLGKADDLDLFIGPTVHGYSDHNQKAMIEFFCKHAGIEEARQLDEVKALTPEQLFATDDGQVIHAGGKPVFELIDQRAADLASRRNGLGPASLKRRLKRLLKMPSWRGRRVPVAHYRVPRPVSLNDKRYARYAVETERDIRAMLKKRLSNPALSNTLDVEADIHLWLPHTSSEEAVREQHVDKYVDPDVPLYLLDVRGLGESMPEPHGSGGFFQPYGMDYMMHGYGILFGESYLGRRIFDLLRTIELLRDEGAETIHLYGRGQGALLGLFAALLHGEVATLTMINGPLTYREWTQAPLVLWPAANFLRGILKHADLPDMMVALGDKLRIAQPWGPDMQPISEQAAETALRRAGIDVSVLQRT